jgi:hypothetical protein
LQALQTQRWKLARTSELNDPADFRPVIAKNMPNSSHLLPPEMVEQQRAYFFRIIETFCGVLSFSSESRDPVLWSHYADNHRGITLGFEFTGELPYPHFQINYSDKPPVVDWLEFSAAQSGGDAALLHKKMPQFFGTKAESWRYEKEWRSVIPIDDRRCVHIGRNIFLPLPTTCLRRVLLGVRCPTTPLEVFRSFRDWKNSCEIEISEMRLAEDSYFLNPNRYDVRSTAVDNPAEAGRLFNTSQAIDRRRAEDQTIQPDM